ncbi:hypothetical protein KBB05_01485 [Patescibacteria group bacterium]|nr:hypothetical protein [Patescibacteria group bacterium]
MRWIVAPYRVKRVALVVCILAITLIPSLLYINTTTDTSSLEAFAYLDQTYQSYEHILTDL